MACKRVGEGEALQLTSWITAFSKAKFGFCTYQWYSYYIRTSGTAEVSQRGGRRGGAPGVTILGWHHIMKWNHISTDLWWRFFFRPHLNWKPTNLAAKTFFGFGIHIFLGWSNPLLWRQWLFFVVTCYWTEKGWHHEIPPRCHHP